MSDTQSRAVAVLAGAAVLMLAVSGLAAAASTTGSISASPATPGSTSTHTAMETLGNQTTGSLNGFKVDYSNSDANVNNVKQSDIKKIGIDRGANDTGTKVDVNVADDVQSVSASNNGKTMKVTLGGSYALHAGDQVVVVYGNVKNPSKKGTYNVTLKTNPQSSGGATTASLKISSSSSSTTTTKQSTTIIPSSTTKTTTQSTTKSTTQSTTQSTTTSSSSSGTTQSNNGGSGGNSSTTTQASSPGFGIAVGAIAALGAALLVLRRKD